MSWHDTKWGQIYKKEKYLGEEHKIFVGGLSWATSDDSLHTAFSSFGDIVFHRVCTDIYTGESRGFGIVSYSTKVGVRLQTAMLMPILSHSSL